jgi:hypothetical protein
MNSVKKEAEKEKERMCKVIDKLEVKSKDKKASEFYEMAKNYFFDGCHFLEKGMDVEAFEAFIISWAYVDAGLKLDFFIVPKTQKEWFTA